MPLLDLGYGLEPLRHDGNCYDHTSVTINTHQCYCTSGLHPYKWWLLKQANGNAVAWCCGQPPLEAISGQLVSAERVIRVSLQAKNAQKHVKRSSSNMRTRRERIYQQHNLKMKVNMPRRQKLSLV
eukprot:6185603-Pleurochrysis_carterae.AAC.9